MSHQLKLVADGESAGSRLRRARRRRGAFTLIEVVLVMAIIILILGLSLPLVERPLAYERLRQAGDQILAEWTTARMDAMRTGEEQYFTIKESYKYRLSADPRAEDSKLPRGVVFGNLAKGEDSRAAFSDGGQKSDLEIVFYPDGTCSDVPELLLSNEYGMQIRLILRGLTGVTRLDDNVPDGNVPGDVAGSVARRPEE
jgi:Tfp pilus assembly protein FimT